MIYLLDTDVFTLAHLGKHQVGERIATARQNHEVAVSVVTRIEVLRGRFDAVVKAADAVALLRMQTLLHSSESYLSEFRLIPFTEESAREFERLAADKAVRKTDRNDLLIACIALTLDATLVTRNTKDYEKVPG